MGRLRTPTLEQAVEETLAWLADEASECDDEMMRHYAGVLRQALRRHRRRLHLLPTRKVSARIRR
jgi:hypothetical protein